MPRLKFVERFMNKIRARQPSRTIRLKGHYKLVGKRADGSIKWVEEFDNIIVNVGLDHTLDVMLDAGSQITTWYVGIKGTGTPVAADTMSSHASWSEITDYSQANRVAWTGGSVASQSIDNSASPASFTINQDATVIYGAFLTSNNTKGGSTGTLWSAGDFASSKSLDNGEILEITITYTSADDGV